jgi:hypothetical protein
VLSAVYRNELAVGDLYLQTWKKEQRNKENSKTTDAQAKTLFHVIQHVFV